MQKTNRGTNNEDLLDFNSSIIVQYIKKNRICSRADISRAVGLTQASISKTIAVLKESGIIEEVGYISGQKGRRSIGISFVESSRKVIGVKLSRRSFAVGVFDLGANPFETTSEEIKSDQDALQTISRIKSVIDKYLVRYEDIAVIGIAVPGPYQRDIGRIALITEMNNWLDIPLRDHFTKSYDIPVIVEHDANAGAFAEWWFGNHYHAEDGTLAYFLVGEGVGAGILVNGNILYGKQGIAGEIGHVSINIAGKQCRCGNRGCLEQYCSSIAFVKNAKNMLSLRPDSVLNLSENLTETDIFTAAKVGDELAINLMENVGNYIGYGVVNIINAYNPDVVVIGNSMAKGGPIILKQVHKIVEERTLKALNSNVKIVLSEFSLDPILYGAAAVGIDYFLKTPALYLTNRN